IFESGPMWQAGVASTTRLQAKRWYHVAVIRTDQEELLYGNGKLEGGSRVTAHPLQDGRRLRFGMKVDGKAALHGWLDEIGFYNRALSAREVRALFDLRESGPCRP